MGIELAAPRLDKRNLDWELYFTKTYRKYRDEHPAIREAMCLKTQFPATLLEIREQDLFAGRSHYGQVGFGLEEATGGPVYYCFGERIEELMKREGCDRDEAYAERVREMIAFWDQEATINGKLASRLPEEVRIATTNGIADSFGRMSGAFLNFDMLLQSGLPALIAEVDAARKRAEREGGDVRLFEGMGMALGLLVEVCLHYAQQAERFAQTATDPERKAELVQMARILRKITAGKPKTLREAVQLFWLYALVSGVANYGRMDVFLGDFYARDIDSGMLSEEEALRLMQSLWQLIADRKITFNGRIIVGGRGRRNLEHADRFAMLAMEATRTVKETEPQLTLRFYNGMNPALMEKALTVIGEGRTYPMLYNDDVNVEAVRKAFGVSREEAEQYLPYGCGEYAIDHTSFGSPNCSLNMLKALEATLFNGVDPFTGKLIGLQTGDFAEFASFEELFAAYRKQVEFALSHLAVRHAYEYEVEREEAAFLYVSMLFDGCIERGRSITDRGAKYLGGIVESFGIVNAADSLTAIKELVYEKRLFTPQKLLEVLQANFEGYERERQLMLHAPHYGNDEDAADRMVQTVSDHACVYAMNLAKEAGLDYFLLVNINNYGNVSAGKQSIASADGRRKGEPLANANTPTAGMDRKGVTAFLNSIVKVNPSVHAGYVQNMKFSKLMFTGDRPKTEALLDAYFMKGGTQAMITVVSRGDLEAAMKEPEKYRNLIVRVGGFSARFVELSRDVQLDVLNRTLY
jgi:pyruvate-formate lyase